MEDNIACSRLRIPAEHRGDCLLDFVRVALVDAASVCPAELVAILRGNLAELPQLLGQPRKPASRNRVGPVSILLLKRTNICIGLLSWYPLRPYVR